MQPVFQNCEQISLDGSLREYQEFGRDNFGIRCNEGRHIFESGLCIPFNIEMTEEVG